MLDTARQTVAQVRQQATNIKNDPKGFVGEVGAEMKDVVSGAVSGDKSTWVWPINGIFYFFSHPELYRPLGPTLMKAVGTSVAITIGMFVFTFIPQAAGLSMFLSPFLGVPITFILVLVETYIIVTLAIKELYIDPLQSQLFARTLTSLGLSTLAKAAEEQEQKASGVTGRVSKAYTKYANKLAPATIARYLLTLPLNFVPVIGTVLFFLINARTTTKSYLTNYYALKQWSKPSIKSFEESRRGSFMAFGAIALALQLVPIAGILFTVTNAVGAAMWAANIEGREMKGRNFVADKAKLKREQ
ncbi:hypothetical protein BC832DRAFT_543935 [Gaertneriomyces semiglobifer]|nr:hypothetical protein BC832DRAFT_543935 [Gaertneriomyces semiglobifer]